MTEMQALATRISRGSCGIMDLGQADYDVYATGLADVLEDLQRWGQPLDEGWLRTAINLPCMEQTNYQPSTMAEAAVYAYTVAFFHGMCATTGEDNPPGA